MRWIITIAICLLSSGLFGQNPRSTNYRVTEGLPSNEIYDIEIAEDGLLWYATDRGVGNFDGKNFTNFSRKDGLSDNTIFEIYKDWNGVLWFSGYNGSLCYYDDGSFESVSVQKLANDSLYYWISEMEQLTDSTYLLAKKLLNDAALLIKQKDGSYKIRSTSSIDDKSEDRIINYTSMRGDKVVASSIQKYTSNFISYHYDRKAILIDRDKNDTIELYVPESIENTFYDTKTSNYLISTLSGLHIYNISNSTFRLYYPSYGITQSIVDCNNNIWVSTLNNGIIKIPNINIEYYDLSSLGSTLVDISYLNETPVFVTSDNKYYSFKNENLVLLHEHKNKTLTIKLKRNIWHNTIETSLGKEIQGKNFEVTDNPIDHDGYTRLYPKGYLAYSSKFVKNINKDASGKYIQSKRPFRPRINGVTQLTKAKAYIKTRNGLYYSIIKDKMGDPILLDATKDKNVSSIALEDDLLFIATLGDGLLIENGEEYSNWSMKNNLLSDFIESIVPLGKHQVLLIFNNGLQIVDYKIDEKSVQIIKVRDLDIDNGIVSSNVKNAIYLDGYIHVLSTYGIYKFRPESINSLSASNSVKITDFKANTVSRDLDTNIVLENEENNIEIGINDIYFSRDKSSKKNYRYSLRKNGKDVNWAETDDNRIRFPRLNPGKYIFELEARDGTEEWNSNMAQLEFQILPHFSDRLWFKILMLLLSILTIALIMIYFQKRIRKRQSEKLALESAKLRANQAELSALRNQMNPHFIYNSLNSIQNFIFKEEPVIANRLITKFSRLVRNSLNFSRLEYVSLEDELSFLQDYIDLEQTRFPNLFEYSVDVEDDILDIEIPPLMIQPLIENAIKHGFSGIQYKGLINIRMTLVMNSYIEISIEDNGRGESAIKGNSLSHKIIRDRIKIFKSNGYDLASLTTNSKGVDMGFICKLVLPAKYEA